MYRSTGYGDDFVRYDPKVVGSAARVGEGAIWEGSTAVLVAV